ncbi:MAG: hypothetical protein Kow00121_33710 [Elainellaceae cyanobacterium]
MANLLNLIKLNEIFQDLSASELFNNLNLENLIQDFSTNPLSTDIDLGDIFSNLSNTNLFEDIELEDLLGDLDGLGLDFDPNNSSVDDLFDQLSDALNNLQIRDLFGNLDDRYSFLLEDVPLDNLLRNLSQLDLGNDFSNPLQVDLLDGFAEVFNILGESDLLNGFQIDQITRGAIGNDLLIGLAVSDCLLGLAGDDRINGWLGRDLINGGAGNDTLKGAAGNDILTSTSGNNRFLGGNGADVLFGGDGIDTLIGGRGRDRFVCGEELGRKIIRDFRDNQDQIALLGNISFDDLNLVQEGRNTLINYGKETIAFLRNVDSDRLTARDFIGL